jgi:hypothetical protein
MSDHGIIHTTQEAPNQLPGEQLTKYSIRVEPTGSESLAPTSRVNYGKPYAIEHNVKVLDVGLVVESHRYMIQAYFDDALRGMSKYSYPRSAGQTGQTDSGYANYDNSGFPQRPGANTNILLPMPKGKGKTVRGTYAGPTTLPYEELDHSYYVRNKSFFAEGRVFSIIWSENPGVHASARARTNFTDYTTSSLINEVRFKNNFIYTTVRRFVVVRQKREFCFACPIFTYSGKATTKHGVRPAEHGIIYTWGKTPQLLPGETGIEKASLSVVMTENETPLHEASRIYYGIHHPIQYNVKVKEIGYVPRDQVPILIGQWKQEDYKETEQSSEVTADGPLEEIHQDEEEDEEKNEEMYDDEQDRGGARQQDLWKREDSGKEEPVGVPGTIGGKEIIR